MGPQPVIPCPLNPHYSHLATHRVGRGRGDQQEIASLHTKPAHDEYEACRAQACNYSPIETCV